MTENYNESDTQREKMIHYGLFLTELVDSKNNLQEIEKVFSSLYNIEKTMNKNDDFKIGTLGRIVVLISMLEEGNFDNYYETIEESKISAARLGEDHSDYDSAILSAIVITRIVDKIFFGSDK